ncbi:MAG: pseudouridine-5'-phosphate glycosidase [Myxococcaceae bacterium]
MLANVSPEVARALEQNQPVVALETSVLAQGLPYPENLEAARTCEEAIRRHGAIPAAIGLIDGEVRVGLSSGEVRRLAGGQGLLKVASRDLAWARMKKVSGGTTVSATCELAATVGIRVFATGGIGGVHRDAAELMDVSQDLLAISKSPVAVVCAGAKSILDLPNTLELLEALAVPVVGVGTSEFPAFYVRGSGLTLEQRVETPQEAAGLMKIRFQDFGQGGMVFALPPPEDTSLPRDEVEEALAAALVEAKARGVRGKALTPFLLRALSSKTGGRTLRANVALLTHNAAFAAAVANCA